MVAEVVSSGPLVPHSLVPTATAFSRILSIVGRPSSYGPVMEAVIIPVATTTPTPMHQHPEPGLPVEHLEKPPSPRAFVNTQWGSDIGAMADGVIPSSLLGFATDIASPVPTSLCSTSRRRRAKPVPPRPPGRSTRLSKKARTCTPALVAAQNILLRKLQITNEEPPIAADVEANNNAF